ncbi:hypothetical protein CBU02nite_37900 [Clostridium butyricum]|uniref:Helicase C-terminal domain-containing protein n=1 Tax=Clostridium butyricum TaxID=1492 RepID=A0A512TSM4_CLOBU|nr:DEAD/DEAH box helicase family protein [Clostridium butyricum]NOW25516.1 hypothetical protein [Clostridium butyricum]GEQ23284.1 hypothetical protein CBU02nite_37900 [Clostridium butyricum]
MYDWRPIIDDFNNNYSIRHVIEVCTGVQIKGKSLPCPIHGGDNKNGASINEGKNVFTCWTSDCGRGLTPWWFIKKYYNLETNKEIAEKVNSLFNANIPIFEKNINNSINDDNNFDKVFKINKYLSECKELKTELQQHKKILLDGNTGIGKTFGIVDIHKDNKNDYVFFLVYTRALAEGVANDYGYELFYDNETELPKSKYIVSTYNKIDAINRNLERENHYRALLNQELVTYSVVCDEVHELMSKRNLLGLNRAIEIEAFIFNSDDCILMSANTNNVYEAYKGINLFNRFIKVESKEDLYNSEKTYIYRIPGKEKQRYSLLLNKIIENLASHSNILLMEDSKKNLEIYSNILSDNGIENVVINSDNKNEEEILEEYNSIIKDSRLKKIVVLCTSVINAGVNIKNDNTCVMVLQDRMQFDSDKVVQFFGRLRTDKNNTCILFLNQGEKNKFRSNKQYYIKYYTDIANIKAMALNEYFFNRYGLEPVETRMKIEWDLYKNNEGYKEVYDLIYIDNGLFKVDHVAVHEKARLKWLRNNYYDDEFIMELFKDLKTRELKITTLAPIAEIADIKDLKEDKEELTLNKALENIIHDVAAVKEFNEYIRGVIKPKNFINRNNIKLYEEFKTNKLYKEMKSNLKTIHNGLLVTRDAAPPISTMLNIMNEYIIDQSKKERDENIKNIKRVEFYNKNFPLGSENIQIQGDIIYSIVRKNCDCFVGNKHPVNKKACKTMEIEYMKLNGYTNKNGSWVDGDGKNVDLSSITIEKLNNCNYKEGEWFDEKGKKIRSETVQTSLNNCIRAIYNCSENLHLYSLK